MAFTFSDPKISLFDGSADKDITCSVKSITIDLERTEHDTTTFCQDAKTALAGLPGGSVSIELDDDYDAGGIDELLWNFFSGGVNRAMKVRAQDDTISTSNPEYQFDVVPTAYTVSAEVDSAASKSLSFPISGAVTRVTS